MADISITAANVLQSTSDVRKLPAAAAITAGQCIYETSSNTIALSDANGATAARTCNGIAVANAASGQMCPYVKVDSSFTCGGTLTSGMPVFVSENAGGITQTIADITSGSTTICLGVATSTTAFNLNPTTGGNK